MTARRPSKELRFAPQFAGFQPDVPFHCPKHKPCRTLLALRAKYIRDLADRGRALRTQESYSSYVADLARYYHRSPDQITYDEVVDWIHHLIGERRQAASSVNIAVNAVRFLYGVTLQRDVQALMAGIPRMKRNTRRAEV